MKKTSLAKILKKAEIINKAIQAEAEEILEDGEMAIKASMPAVNVPAALQKLENKLQNESVEAQFDKKISKEAMAKTAEEKLSDEDVEKIVDQVVEAIVAEFEEVLEDADEVCDDAVKEISDDDEAIEIVEGKLKTTLERKLAGMGIYAKLNRVHKKAKVAKAEPKKTALDAFKERRNKRKQK